MAKAKQPASTTPGVEAGFTLSVVALLILWIGTPWPYQFLMTVPFVIAAFAIRRSGKTALSMLAGILPIGLLFLSFEDPDHSHLYPFLLVVAWALAIVLGHHLGGRARLPHQP